MLDGKNVLGVIPARGGSKGLPRKNVLPLAGKPLIAWTIDAGRSSKYIDHLILSTDDHEIAEVGRAWGADVPFIRPPHLAGDETPMVEVVRHVLHEIPGYDLIVLLQPTSPLRTAEDIDGCIAMLHQKNASTAVTVAEAEVVPQWLFHLDPESRLQPIMPGDLPHRRQAAGKVFTLNGAVYVGTREAYSTASALVGPETIAYVMPRERSIDVDTLFDLKVCETLLRPDRQ